MKPLASIIIVNYNGFKFLPDCLLSCQQVDYPNFEIVLIDNGSTDGSQEWIKTYSKNHRNFHYYLNSGNKGLAEAQNQGAKIARGTHLLFLNNDTIIDKKILTELLYMYGDNIGVLGCRMGDYNGTRELDSFISVDRFGYPCGTTANMFYPDGAIFISQKVFNEIGGFDRELFLFGEDRDLCWRVHLAGYLVLGCNNAVFYHASSCVYGTTYFRRYHAEKNLIRSMIKNYGGVMLWEIAFQYATLSLCELLFLSLTGNVKSVFRCYLKAYWWNVIHLKSTLQERERIQTSRKVNDAHIRKIMSKEIGKLFVLRKFGVPKFSERSIK